MNSTWSKAEKIIARKAFDKAYQKECKAITNRVQAMAEKAHDPMSLWKIHDYLELQRKETDEKYDYRYSILLLVFTRLLKEGWLEEADLVGLNEDKLDEIKRILGFSEQFQSEESH